MRQPYLVAGALLVSLWLGAGAVNAQEEPGRIPGSALGAQGALSDKDQKFVTDYIDYHIKGLTSGDPERIALARGRLIEAYSQGGMESFTSFYDQTLANRIGEGLTAKDVAGRLNTAIVLRAIRHAKVVDAIKTALKDEVTAIVYQAAVAAEIFTGRTAGELAPKLALRGPLVDALKKESNNYVLEPLYLATANIIDPTAWEAALVKMNERLAVHVAKGTAGGYEAEAAGLRGIQSAIITGKAGGQNIPAKVINLLLLTSIRYMDWAVSQPWPQSDAIKAFIKSCEDGAKWTATTSGGTAPANSVAAAKTQLEQQLFTLDWKAKLKADPFKFKDEEVNLPKPPAN